MKEERIYELLDELWWVIELVCAGGCRCEVGNTFTLPQKHLPVAAIACKWVDCWKLLMAGSAGET